MKVGFIGDIVGKPGREMLQEHLLRLKKEHQLDFVVANSENASHGFGLGLKNAKELFEYGIDVCTGGNHSWDKKDIFPYMDTLPILRPYNFPDGVPGRGFIKVQKDGKRLGVINLMGNFAMPWCENPFLKIDEILGKLEDVDSILVDFHAEATSEKYVMLSLLKGRVSALFGTHTHVGTDDLSIHDGTAYVSDVGLSGCCDGIIGMDKQSPIKRALTGMSHPLDIPTKCKKIFQMIVFESEGLASFDTYKIRICGDNERIDRAWDAK